jgi:hypothetical protein
VWCRSDGDQPRRRRCPGAAAKRRDEAVRDAWPCCLPRERSAKLAEALQLWRGPALADLAAEPGLQTDIARLDELRLTTLERRIDADLETGRERSSSARSKR